MLEGPAIAKYGACVLIAAYSFVPFGRTRTCTGPGCPNGQCSRQATVTLRGIPVSAAPEIFTEVLGDRLVLVEEPIHEGEPEDLVSPIAELQGDEVKAEVDAEVAAEPVDEPAPEKPKATAKAAVKSTPKTRQVWMKASDAQAAGLTPIATATQRSGYGSSGSAFGMGVPVATQATYATSYGCTGSGVQAFYGVAQEPCQCVMGGQTVQLRSANYYRPRSAIFPNLFPRLRGLR